MFGEPADELEALDPAVQHEPRQEADERAGEHAGDGDDDQPGRIQPLGAPTPALVAASGVIAALSISPSRTSERQIEPMPTRLPGNLPNHRDAHDLVGAAGKRETGDRRSASGGGEREHSRALVVTEEPVPAPGLEAEGAEEERAGPEHAEDVRVSERPAVGDEVARRQQADADRDRGRHNIEGDAGTTRPEQPQEIRLQWYRPQVPVLGGDWPIPSCITNPTMLTPLVRVDSTSPLSPLVVSGGQLSARAVPSA